MSTSTLTVRKLMKFCNAVTPLNSGNVGTSHFFLCSEVVISLLVEK